MTQQIINLGTQPNDGTGDTDRNAFTKVNANFTELYSTTNTLTATTSTQTASINSLAASVGGYSRPYTSFLVDSNVTYPTSSTQYDNLGTTQLTNGISGGHGRTTPTVVTGGGPFGEDCVRVYPEVGVNGRGNVLIGATGALGAGSIYDPILAQYGLNAKQGISGVWVKFNLDGTDSLDANSANVIQPDIFVWPSSKEATLSPNSALLRQELLANGQWRFLPIGPTQWSGGDISTALNGGLQIGCIGSGANAGRTTTMDVGPAYWNIKQSKASFCVALDNDDATHFTNAYPYANARGVKLTIYSDPNIWGNAGVCTASQIATMAANGHSICYHGNGGTAADLTNGYYNLASNATLLAAVQAEIATLKSLGYDWQHMAWPLGMYDYATEQLFRGMGILSARAIGAQSGYAVPPQNAFYKWGYGPWATTTSDTWATIKANIDNTVTYGGHLEIWGHVIQTGNLTTFKQTIEYLVYLRDKGLCDLLTAPQYYTKYLKYTF